VHIPSSSESKVDQDGDIGVRQEHVRRLDIVVCDTPFVQVSDGGSKLTKVDLGSVWLDTDRDQPFEVWHDDTVYQGQFPHWQKQ